MKKRKKMISNSTENNKQKNDFWNEISDFEKRELLTAIEESKHPENLIPHEEVKKKYSKWLKK